MAGGKEMGYEIRHVAQSDFCALLKVEHDAFGGDGYSPYFLKMVPQLYPLTCFVATVDESLVGYSLGARDGHDESIGWILTVAVMPARQGQGIGKALAERLVQAMQSLGMTTLILTVEPSNPAIELYAQLGFVEAKLEIDCYGPGKDRLYMERKVRP